VAVWCWEARRDAGLRVIEVVAPGPLCTVQDLGRFGYAALGVGRSGAADVASLMLANRVVGNPDGAAGLEITLGGFAGRFSGPAVIALAGASCPAVVDGRPVAFGVAVEVGAGQLLRLRTPRHGLRTYLAVRGGIDAPLVLGSRSTDTLAGIVPLRVVHGSVLPVGSVTPAGAMEQGRARAGGGPAVVAPADGARTGDVRASGAVPKVAMVPDASALGAIPDADATPAAGAASAVPAPGASAAGVVPDAGAAADASAVAAVQADVGRSAEEEVVLRVVAGPRDDWFADGLDRLCSGPYEVARDSNRVGMRLSGPFLDRAVTGELPSEGMVAGALQVPPDGQPVLFLADHPVTGGYPVLAVVADADIGLAAQVRPGRTIRFEVLRP
jgi:allophanate hydrolase subunit 2